MMTFSRAFKNVLLVLISFICGSVSAQRAIPFPEPLKPDYEKIAELAYSQKLIAEDYEEVLDQLESLVNDYIDYFAEEELLKGRKAQNKLLKLLAMYKNDLLPRDLALTKIWRDDNYFTSRSMDVYIAKLRKYLKPDESVEIINIHGEGFRLVVN